MENSAKFKGMGNISLSAGALVLVTWQTFTLEARHMTLKCPNCAIWRKHNCLALRLSICDVALKFVT